MRVKYVFICILCSVLMGMPLHAQTAQLDARFDSTYILIGDQIHFRVRLEQTGPVTVTFPEWKDTLIKAIEILEVSPIDTTSSKDGSLIISQDLLITGFDSGIYFVPHIAFPVDVQGNKDTLFTPVAGLQVFSMPLDTAQAIFDIKPLYEMPVTWQEIWHVVVWVLVRLIGVGILILLLILLWQILVKKKKPLAFFRKRIIEPPHVVALRDLEHLRVEKLWQKGHTKAYYTRLTDILRVYIDGRYGVNAMESTSYEILQELKKAGMTDQDLYQKISDMFSCADLVKFAKLTPSELENDAYLLDAVVFVNHTKSEEQVTTEVQEEIPAAETGEATSEPVKPAESAESSAEPTES